MLTDKPWKIEAVAKLGLGMLSGMMLGVIATGVLKSYGDYPFATMVIGALSFHGVALPCLWLFVRAHGIRWTEAFGFTAPGSNRAVLLAFGAALVTLPAAWGLGWVSAQMLSLVHIEPTAQRAVTMVQETVEIGPQILLAAVAIVLAPTVEELLFRGVLYPALRRGFSGWAVELPEGVTLSRVERWLFQPHPRVAVVATSVLFGAIHLNLMTFVPLTLLGFVLIWLYETTGNLMAPILCHSLFNLANFFLLIQTRAGT